jgi:hypothetical protein
MQTTPLGLVSKQTLPISIGQVPLTLHIREEALLRKAVERYAAFCEPSREALPVFLQPEMEPTEDSVLFSHGLQDASLFLRANRVDFCGVRHEYALDSLLRVLLTFVLVPRGGFLLHAATVVRDGRAYVFTGRSGAGKSTVASLSPRGSVLTDEISLLRHREDGWHAYGTPFWGEFRAAGSNRHFPVAGVYALAQSKENRLEPLARRQSLRALLPNVLFFGADRCLTDGLLQLLTVFTEQVPFNRLHFRRRRDFWEVVAP